MTRCVNYGIFGALKPHPPKDYPVKNLLIAPLLLSGALILSTTAFAGNCEDGSAELPNVCYEKISQAYNYAVVTNPRNVKIPSDYANLKMRCYERDVDVKGADLPATGFASNLRIRKFEITALHSKQDVSVYMIDGGNGNIESEMDPASYSAWRTGNEVYSKGINWDSDVTDKIVNSVTMYGDRVLARREIYRTFSTGSRHITANCVQID
jgi:hypothetical protein